MHHQEWWIVNPRLQGERAEETPEVDKEKDTALVLGVQIYIFQ